MVKAINMMKANPSPNQERYINSRLYMSYKKDFSITQSISQTGNNNSQYGSCWIYSVDLELCKKISTAVLDNYMIKGRVLDLKTLYTKCESCNKSFFKGKTRIKYCSDACKDKKYHDIDTF